MSLKVNSKEKQSGVFIISCNGSLNTNTYSILENRINLIFEGSPRLIVFDMENLDYISSMGVRVVLNTQKKMRELGGSSRLMNLKPQVERVFEIINALPSDQVFASEAEMDAYLDKIQKRVTEE